MAFKGMNPEEGREVAKAISDAGQRILDAVGNMTPIIGSVEWVGADYDSYKEDWNAFISGELDSLTTRLDQKYRELETHAEEQDTTSNAG